MRFGSLHRIAMDAIASLGLLAMIACGAWPGLAVAMAIAIALPERFRARVLTTAVTFLAAGAFVLVRALYANAIVCILDGTGAALVVCVASRVGAARDRPIAALAFLGAALAGVIGAGVVYGALLTALVVVTPGALLLSHLRREVEGNYRQGARDRSGSPVDVPRILRSRRVVGRETAAAALVLGIATALAGACAFVLLPRVGLDLFGVQRQPERSLEIDLSRRDVPGDALVLRYESPVHPLRLRGAVLDVWDGTRWSRSPGTATHAYAGGAHEGVHVLLEADALGAPMVLVPDRAGAVTSDVPLVALESGELRFEGATRRPLRWEAWISRGNIEVTSGNINVTTAPVASTRVRALAHAWSDDQPTPLGKARALERRLRDGYTYDLRSPSRGAVDPLDHFLFVTKRGHCELFASALAVMLREIGVPARVVTGYVGGDWNAFGRFYAVRDRDAHAWVEAWTGSTWTTLDATPTGPRVEESGAFASARDLAEALSRRTDEPSWIRTLRIALLVSFALLLLVALVARLRRGRVTGTASPLRSVDVAPRTMKQRPCMPSSKPPSRRAAFRVTCPSRRCVTPSSSPREGTHSRPKSSRSRTSTSRRASAARPSRARRVATSSSACAASPTRSRYRRSRRSGLRLSPPPRTRSIALGNKADAPSVPSRMAITRARRLAASAAMFGASGGLGWVLLRDRFWDVNPLLVIVTLSVALAGVGIARKSVLAQIGARAVAWSVALPMALVATLELASGSHPDRLVWFLAATTGSALLLGRPMLHTDEAKREFAPVRFRRAFLAAATAAASTSLFAGAAALDLAHSHHWSAAFGIGALAASLVASAFGTLRMRGWGILLGAATSVVSLLAALFMHDAGSIALALAAIPGALLALPIVASRVGVGEQPERRTRVEAELPPRVRVAVADESVETAEAHVEPVRARAEVG